MPHAEPYDRNTILIIGAGASKDLHPAFGLGPDLLQDISDRVTDRTSQGQRNLSILLDTVGLRYSDRWDFVHHLDEYKRNSDYPSIDAFLDEVNTYPEYEDRREAFFRIAQFAIIFHILGYEGSLASEFRDVLTEDAWINHLCKFIADNSLLADNGSGEHRLKIITFNYDRNLEHFMYNFPAFAGNKAAIKKFIDKSIAHVYGKIGELEWQNPSEYLPYGNSNSDYQSILKNTERISLMFSQRALTSDEERKKAKGWLTSGSYNCLATLGFNFDYLNCKLLDLPNFGQFSGEPLPFIANIYPHAGTNFAHRRSMAQRIRNTKHDARLTYLTCPDFVNFVLQTPAEPQELYAVF